MLFSSGPWRNRLERHSIECGTQKLIEKIYGRYKMFDLASSGFLKCRSRIVPIGSRKASFGNHAARLFVDDEPLISEAFTFTNK